MTRLRLPLPLALLCVFVAVTMTVPATAAAANKPSKRMAQGINWWRDAAGRSRVSASARLAQSSRRRARLMMRRDFFAHPRRLRVGRFDRVGEVLALHSGRRARVASTIRRWARSSSHRHVLLSRGVRRIGVGRATGRWRGHKATIWVVRVGRA